MANNDNEPRQLTAEEREEVVDMHVVARPGPNGNGGMRWKNPGEPAKAVGPGDVIKVQRKNARWLEASRKAFRDAEKAAKVSAEILETFGHTAEPAKRGK